MRRASSAPLPAQPDRAYRGDWRTIGTLLPYLFAYKGRVFLALGCLVLAKVANVTGEHTLYLRLSAEPADLARALKAK